jgi:hypothetical protein
MPLSGVPSTVALENDTKVAAGTTDDVKPNAEEPCILILNFPPGAGKWHKTTSDGHHLVSTDCHCAVVTRPPRHALPGNRAALHPISVRCWLEFATFP